MGQLRYGVALLRHSRAGLQLSGRLASAGAPAAATALVHSAGQLVKPSPARQQPQEKAWTAPQKLHYFHTGLPRLAEAARQADEELPDHPKDTHIDKEANAPHKSFDDGYIAPHPGAHGAREAAPLGGEHSKGGQTGKTTYWLMQPIYSQEYVNSVRPRHKVPTTMTEKTGYWAVTALRSTFDLITGYSTRPGAMTEQKWLLRIIFLETTAGVPGMVGAAARHFRSLRTMKRDHGWVHTLLGEAENERMHLLTFLEFSKPSAFMRFMVLVGQGVFLNLYTMFYLLSPSHCHAFVGYLEEEAVKTYTHCLADIDAGRLWQNEPAPEIAKKYWGLKEDATMRDVICNVRADEACHSHVNHEFSRMPATATNPFGTASHEVP